MIDRLKRFALVAFLAGWFGGAFFLGFTHFEESRGDLVEQLGDGFILGDLTALVALGVLAIAVSLALWVWHGDGE